MNGWSIRFIGGDSHQSFNDSIKDPKPYNIISVKNKNKNNVEWNKKNAHKHVLIKIQ
jgi:hypothetical protein